MKKIAIRIVFMICVLALLMPFNYNVSMAYSCGYKGDSFSDGYICCGNFHTFGHQYYLPSYENKIHGLRLYSIESGFSEKSEEKINKAISAWNTQISKHNMTKYLSLSETNSNIQIYIKTGKLEKGTLGCTRFLNNSGGIVGTNSKGELKGSYSKTEIYLDISSTVKKKTAAHEIGHALGLSHRLCNTKSIMYNFMNKDIEVSSPQNIDLNTIRHLYC
ncbi:MAG: matrixin family metalloprotease [Eubacteriales bacterium]|nr:matrixin family metalloprotease [Eubacteriales bacterium]